MTLDQAEPGQRITIRLINDSEMRAKIIRMGVTEGDEVLLAEKLPGGPVIIRHHRQEIAVGRRLARKISIEPLSTGLSGAGKELTYG